MMRGAFKYDSRAGAAPSTTVRSDSCAAKLPQSAAEAASTVSIPNECAARTMRTAIYGAVARALDQIVRDLEQDPDAWVVVLTGSGGQAFCSGADLKEVARGNLGALWTTEGGFAGFVRACRSKVWIAAVDGFALAGGFEIALACDLIVASVDATFGLPEVRRGLSAAP